MNQHRVIGTLITISTIFNPTFGFIYFFYQINNHSENKKSVFMGKQLAIAFGYVLVVWELKMYRLSKWFIEMMGVRMIKVKDEDIVHYFRISIYTSTFFEIIPNFYS
jgi:hypothetical protein